MTPQKESEVQGSLLSHPFAELLTEIGAARLYGSLRVSADDKKCIVYFNEGRIVFAVSNARSSRLFDILMRQNRLTSEDLAKIPNFSNDFELEAYLTANKFFTKAERDALFIGQMEAIIIDIMSWVAGDWSFSWLSRLRDGLTFDIDSRGLLADYGRCVPWETILKRFRSLDEVFVRSEHGISDLNLKPNELTVLAAIGDGKMTATEMINRSPIPETAALQAIYTLWLAGLVERREWHPAFSDMKLSAIRNAKLELKREAKLPEFQNVAAAETASIEVPAKPEPPPEIKITVDEYLTRVEGAETLYDVLGVEPTVEMAEIKRTYFALAKVFHPDHFYKEGEEIMRRVQHAFTALASAHDTLKTVEIRQHYDFKIRKELADKQKLQAAGTYDERSQKLQQAAESFERGFSLLMDNQPEAATTFLARAAHFDSTNARYHAYYGKALSFDDKQRHKAESEMQTALRIDPNNQTLRLLLIEFFIQVNLTKRAEGELTRLLAIFPSNREAQKLMAGLKK